ncbi:MAG: xanthine dehydrogenase family protein molybdopterin-binding subunit [Gammaproteobacteria bacterium]|nr:xanthine dehydrogenase family protein molybdopterin-binding subunit [Gammaproteobacteria bacterium]
MAGTWVGTSVKRKQDGRLLTGRGTYVDDMQLPHMLYCGVFRSVYAHARIRSVDVSEALAQPGIVAAITGADVADYPLPAVIDAATFGQKDVTGHAFPLAVDKVRYAGEPVAAIAGVDRYVVEDALELIRAQYEPLPPVLGIEQAMRADAPLLYDAWGDNIHLRWQVDMGDVEGAFAHADHVFRERLYEHRYSGFPMEARCVLASYNSADGKLDVWSSTQAPFQARMYIARTLKLPEQNVRVVVPDLGGGFGNKLNWSADIVPCLLSLRTGRPVKWTETRTENLQASPHSRDYVYDVQVACRNDGTIEGVKLQMIADAGVEGANRGAAVATLLVAGSYVLGPYKIANLRLDQIAVVTNKSFYCAYRGYGKDMANRVLERMINIMARELGMAPEQIRMKNYIQPHEYPYRQTTGVLYDSGNMPEITRRALARVDFEQLAADKARLRNEGIYLGVGMAAKLEPSGGAVPNSIFNGFEGAAVKITSEGGITLATSLVDMGQGVETTLAQVVADEFGVSPDDVRVIEGDTDMTPIGGAGFSSRGAVWTASCVLEASRKLKQKVLKVAANLLQVAADTVELKDGTVFVSADPERSLTLQDIGRAAYFWPGPYAAFPLELLADDASLEVTSYWTSPSPPTSWEPPVCLYTTHPSSFEVAIVQIDGGTGRLEVRKYICVHDCGKLINPMIVEGQVHGGTLQGIGGAVYEQLVYDENGQLLTTTFMDYLIPTAMEAPDMEVEHFESPSPFTPLGTKGMGEGSTIASPSVIINAVEDALGVTVKSTPLTPERVLALIREAQQQAGTPGPA